MSTLKLFNPIFSLFCMKTSTLRSPIITYSECGLVIKRPLEKQQNNFNTIDTISFLKVKKIRHFHFHECSTCHHHYYNIQHVAEFDAGCHLWVTELTIKY